MDDVERLADHVGFLVGGRLALEEPMRAPVDRFRRVEVSLPDGAAVPAQRPDAWLGFTVEGRAARFIDSRVSAASPSEWASAFPGAAIESARMSLRTLRSCRPAPAACRRRRSRPMTAPVSVPAPLSTWRAVRHLAASTWLATACSSQRWWDSTCSGGLCEWTLQLAPIVIGERLTTAAGEVEVYMLDLAIGRWPGS